MRTFSPEVQDAILELVQRNVEFERKEPIVVNNYQTYEKSRWLDLHGIESDSAGFGSFKEYVRAVISRAPDERLKALLEQDDSAGGFLVPSGFLNSLMTEVLEQSVVFGRCKLFPMKHLKLLIPGVEIVDHNGTSHPLLGGILSDWRTSDADNELEDFRWGSEGTEPTLQKPKFRLMTLEARKLTCYTRASSELLADSNIVTDYIETIFRQAMRWYIDYALINGSGSQEPLGFRNANCVMQVPRAAASAIDWTDIINMVESIYPASWSNSIWLASPSTIDQIFSLHQTAGSQVEGVSMWPSLSEATPANGLLGRPLYFTEKLPALGSEADLCLCDFSQMAVGIRDDITLQASVHEHFSRDLVSFRAIARLDSQPLWNTTCTLADGTETSPFVVLSDAP